MVTVGRLSSGTELHSVPRACTKGTEALLEAKPWLAKRLLPDSNDHDTRQVKQTWHLQVPSWSRHIIRVLFVCAFEYHGPLIDHSLCEPSICLSIYSSIFQENMSEPEQEGLHGGVSPLHRK